MEKPRYHVQQNECGEGNWSYAAFVVVDRKLGRAMGRTSEGRDGCGARELAEIQCRALNKANANA